FDVAVADQLARGLAARREAHPVDHIVQAALEGREEVVARHARQGGHLLERVAELTLRHAIDALDLLLLTELLRVLAHLAAAGRVLAVLTRGIRTTLDRALLGEALRALEEQLRAFTPALPAAGTSVTHR